MTTNLLFLKSMTISRLASYSTKAFAQATGRVSTGLVSCNRQNTGNTDTVWKNNRASDDAARTGTIVYNSTTDLVNLNRSYTFNTSWIFTLPAALDVSGSYSVSGVATVKTIGVNGRVLGSALSNVLLGYWNSLMNTIYYDRTPNNTTAGVNSVTAFNTNNTNN